MAERKPLTDAEGEVRELDEEDFKHFVPFSQLPESLQLKLLSIKNAEFVPVAAEKERVTLNLSPEVVTHFRKTGSGWQDRVDQACQDWVRQHEKQTIA